jgi:hypothetical protein
LALRGAKKRKLRAFEIKCSYIHVIGAIPLRGGHPRVEGEVFREWMMVQRAEKRTSGIFITALPVLILAMAAAPCSVHAMNESHEMASSHTRSESGHDNETDCISLAPKPASPAGLQAIHPDAAVIPSVPVLLAAGVPEEMAVNIRNSPI